MSRIRLGRATPYSFDILRALARKNASEPYRAAPESPSAAQVNYDISWKIKFRPEYALWRNSARYPVRFFHPNVSAREAVAIHMVEGGRARPVLPGPDYFDYSLSGIRAPGQRDFGFAGFRVMNGRNDITDWLAFQGTNYFRSAGQDNQYGISARGVAINTALVTQEEFPRFTQFWLSQQNGLLRVDALLDGPTVTGAYRFDVRKGTGVVMDTHCELFFRADVSRLGLAPLTSMYWYGENERWRAPDWRPEIHDSDGLALHTSKGERIWRPLTNPSTLQTNFFLDENPRGFGLMQRDRSFEQYQDDGAFYHRRPGLWVQPRGNWGRGSVMLAELPTDHEANDNIVAYWMPERPIAAGDTLSLDYRLTFANEEPGFPAGLGRCIATRIGRGGTAGGNSMAATSRRFAIDFFGGDLMKIAKAEDIKPVVTLSRGTIQHVHVAKIAYTNRWRTVIDIDATGPERVELKCYLQGANNRRLTETWLYHYFY